MYRAPDKNQEGAIAIAMQTHIADVMRQYLLQLRQETGVRLAEKVYPDGKPNKWWLCFAKRRFMDKTLVPLGANI